VKGCASFLLVFLFLFLEQLGNPIVFDIYLSLSLALSEHVLFQLVFLLESQGGVLYGAFKDKLVLELYSALI
jgi:hypothetical protein